MVILLSFAGSAPAADALNPSDVTRSIRSSVEEQFRASTGLAFSTFQCDHAESVSPGRELACSAVDEEGDRFVYRIVLDAEGSASISMSQPVDQLNPEGLQAIERPCLAFLDGFGRAEWGHAYRQLSDSFQAGFSMTDLKATLAPLRDTLENLQSIEAESYSAPSPGIHQLEYALATKGGDAVARFRLEFIDDENARITAFLLTARPGSVLQSRLLSETGRGVLTPLVGRPVERIDGSLADLAHIGDVVQGEAVLQDGTAIPIQVEQHGTAYDIDGNDYRFQILDLSTLVRRYLVSTAEPPRRIDCPVPVAPDGGRVDCVATLGDGSTRAFTIIRRGGEHRLLESK